LKERKANISLINFKYLLRQQVLALIVTLTLISTLFSITAYSFLGFYNGFTNYVGEQKNIVAIYSNVGSTPFTGIIPLTAENEIATLEGVESTSPEVIAPCTLNNQSVFIRGVVPEELIKLNPLTLTQGNNLNFNDTDSAIIGKSLSGRLNLKTGDAILALSALSPRYVELQIKGIFQSSSPLDDEALVPLYVGQWLRNLDYNRVTLIRAKINLNQTSPDQLYKQLAQKTPTNATATPSPSPSQVQQEIQKLVPLLPRALNISSIGIEESQQFMQDYLNRYGISKDTLIILSSIILAVASGIIIVATGLFMKQHENEIKILKSLGASNKKIKTDLTIRMLTWSLTATILGTIISIVFLFIFQNMGYLQVLSHTITFQIDPLVIVANFTLISLMMGIYIARMKIKT
jgi:ABC-type lipoprotein release transport system permease subunit